jgi:hypothetical protein
MAFNPDVKQQPLSLEELNQLWEEVEDRTRPAWQRAFENGNEEAETKVHDEHQSLLQTILDNANLWRSSTGHSPLLELPMEERAEARTQVKEFISLVLAERRRILKLKGEIP